MRYGLMLAVLAALLGGSGCCRLCERWCGEGDGTRRYAPGCNCDRARDDDRLPPPAPRFDTRSKYEDEQPRRDPPRVDDKPTGDPRLDRTPSGAYGGSGN